MQKHYRSIMSPPALRTITNDGHAEHKSTLLVSCVRPGVCTSNEHTILSVEHVSRAIGVFLAADLLEVLSLRLGDP